MKCIICDDTLKNKRTTYCSTGCSSLARRNESFLKFLEGKLSHPRILRTLLIELYKNTCQKCGISNWNNLPISLEVEHIDGNSDNNFPINLTLLCPNCHSQTSTYKSKNKGNGRYLRRKRYEENKSY